MNESVALLCDLDGRVLEVLRTCAGVPSLAPGDPAAGLVAASSRGDLGAMLERLRVDGHAIGWRLVVPVGGRDSVFLAAGARVQDHLLVLACPAQDPLDLAGDLYDEMSRLNNDLATMQREIVRRSASLEALIREKNEILGMAAHDLRNPLAAMQGLVGHLMGELASVVGERHMEMLEHLRASSEHMLHLVDDLLDLTALSSGTLTLTLGSTDLPALVGRTVRLARELARDKGIDVDMVATAPPAVAHAAALDSHKITQALTNLLTNAIKFSHPGATITVRVDYSDVDVRVAVSDRGVGMDQAQLQTLFKPFRRGRPGTRGERSTGLGLTIVRRIIQGHGGDVTVESRLAEGSTFTIHLPLRPMAAVAPAAGRPARMGDVLDVLVADDDPATRMVVRCLLEALGCRVGEAEGALEAIAAAREGRYDLVIVDVEMPGGGGRAVVEALRAEGGATTPVAALSGHADPAAALAGGPGFDAYLTKPVGLDDLAALIAGLCPRSRRSGGAAEG